MPDTPLQRALRDSVKEVLEKMFFVEPVEEQFPTAESGSGAIAVGLAFDGSPSGSLCLCVGNDAARQIAADFLGEGDDSLPVQKVQEVICELANMICGSFLSHVETSTTFRLASPHLGAEPPADSRPVKERTAHAVQIAAGSLMVIVETRE